MRIDSHHHLWNYDPTQYPWIDDAKPQLKRDFTTVDLQAVLSESGITGTVAVQARQSLEETSWLLSLADKFPEILGVVGWVPLASDDAVLRRALDSYEDRAKLRGVRHVVHDEPDDRFILRDDFNRGITRLRDYGLVYDILIFAKHLAATIEFVDRHVGQIFVVDHIAKPTITAKQFDATWAKQIRELAKRPNVACKISGMATEVRDEEWSDDLLTPYWEVALEAFGSERLMFGSDWPVCLLKTPYKRWVSTFENWLARLTAEEQAKLWYGNAMHWYQLSLPSKSP